MYRRVVARFRRPGDAETHLRGLRRFSSGVVFMPPFMSYLGLGVAIAEQQKKTDNAPEYQFSNVI